ncbi:CheY-like chemotaxis protein [Flavobacterium sp. 270]|uniref:response regulator n=1 Tax=Flavobacterium sp. 270 TaxID=2512114 RepID=UPI0010669792|nr:response regulator [Flavobacterium sp. 270]TDW47821.1 CheY-like chemotaxis protein [Flavobacterium sp. 270]
MFNVKDFPIMNVNGEIIVVEDDLDDQDFLADIFESLNISNKIVFFDDPTMVVPYLLENKAYPFLVLSDINMPKLDGFGLRQLIMSEKRLEIRFIPYIYLSTSSDPSYVDKAFRLSAQGYFKKESNFSDFQTVIENIIAYWKKCHEPQAIL